jgi:prephenate dehydratase
LLLEHDLPITGEVEIPVAHCLQACPARASKT